MNSLSNLHSVAARPIPSRTRGFTLMEVMVGMMVFTVLALGVTSTIIQSRKLAQLNILRNAAWNAAQGYLEQMLSINPADIEAASEPWVSSRPPIPTESVNALLTNTQAIEVADPLYVSPLSAAPSGSNMTARTDVAGDMWNVKQIMIDMNTVNGTSAPVVMSEYFDVNVSRAWTQVGGSWQVPQSPAQPGYFLIKIDFQFKAVGYNAVGWLKGSVRMARTDIAGP